MKQHGRAPQLRPRNLRKTVVRMFSYFKYNKLLFVGGLILIVLGSLARIGANGMLSPIIDSWLPNRVRLCLSRIWWLWV